MLGEIGPRARDAIPELQKLLNPPGERAALAAASALCRIDAEQSATFLPMLINAFRDPSNPNRAAAVHALGETRAEKVIPVLESALKDEDWMVADAAARALANQAWMKKP